MRIGFDPEVFWTDGNKMISVIDKLGGTKSHARKVSDIVQVLEDNVAAEFNSPPCSDVGSFIKAIEENLNYLRSHAATLGYKVADNVSFTEFPIEELQSPMAFVFGCEPDYNAWTGEMNPAPIAANPFVRSAGGHVHVESDADKTALVRAMDLFLGVPSTVFDKEVRRRELYGKAGAYRPKDYGIEYRTLSNFWIFSKDTMKFVWERTEMAIDFAKSVSLVPTSEVGHAIRAAIDNNNVQAREFVFDTFPEAAV